MNPINRFIKLKHPKLFKQLVGIQLISAKTGDGIDDALAAIGIKIFISHRFFQKQQQQQQHSIHDIL
jgi:hypothetical protein